MISVLVSLLVLILIMGLVWWVGTLIINTIPFDPTVKQIATVILAVIILLILLYWALPLVHLRPFD